MIRLFHLAAVTGLFLVTNAWAQEAPAAPAEGPNKLYQDVIKTPLVPPRSQDEIRQDQKRAEEDTERANKSIADAQARVKEAEGWVKAHKLEMDQLKKKIDAAKKEKRDSDKIMLEAQFKQLELVEDYLRRMQDVRSVEVEVAGAQKDLANSRKKAAEAELDLTGKADAWKQAPPSDPTFFQKARTASEAGANTLRAMREMADKNTDVASRFKKLADKRVALVEARNRLLSEDLIRAAQPKPAQ